MKSVKIFQRCSSKVQVSGMKVWIISFLLPWQSWNRFSSNITFVLGVHLTYCTLFWSSNKMAYIRIEIFEIGPVPDPLAKFIVLLSCHMDIDQSRTFFVQLFQSTTRSLQSTRMTFFSYILDFSRVFYRPTQTNTTGRISRYSSGLKLLYTNITPF